MNRSRATVGAVVALGLLVSFASAPAAAQDARHAAEAVVDLGTLGHDVSVAVAVNDTRQVIGWIADNFTPFRAPFLWEDGVMRELTAGPGLILLDALDINDRGQIAGYGTEEGTFRTFALLWDEDGRVTRLPTPSDDLDCLATDINNRGAAAGYCVAREGTGIRYHAVLWRDGTAVHLAGAGTDQTVAAAVNDRGVVLAAFVNPDGSSRGSFLWADGVVTRLDPALSAAAINDRGQITGGARLVPGLGFSAFILDRGTVVTLPSPGEAFNCLAASINRHAAVGGTCIIAPVVWVDGRARALPTLSEFAAGVLDVNDRGDAVGYSTTPSPDNNSRAVLWPGAARRAGPQVKR